MKRFFKLLILIVSFLVNYQFSKATADTIIFKDGDYLSSTMKEDKIDVPKHILFLEASLLEYMALSINYQKQVMLISPSQRLYISIGVGFHGIELPDSYSLPLSLRYTLGNANALEVGIGTLFQLQENFILQKSMGLDAVKLTGSLAYRFQKKYISVKGETDTDYFTLGLKTIYQFNSNDRFKQHFITAITININFFTLF